MRQQPLSEKILHHSCQGRVGVELIRKYIELDNGTISYLEGGNTETSPFPLIFLHGFYLSSQAYYNSLVSLARKYRVLAPDLPGFGFTKYKLPKSPSYADYTVMLREFLHSVGISREVSLLGHSMGGGISIHFSATNPKLIHRLVLIDSAGLPFKLNTRLILQKFWEFSIIQGINTNFSPEYRNMVQAAISNFQRFELRTQLNILKFSLFEDLSQLATEINSPTKVVWGRRDLSIPYRYGIKLSRMIPYSTITILNALYHDWCALYPNKLFDAVNDDEAVLYHVKESPLTYKDNLVLMSNING